jgi:alanine racemase
VVEIDLDALRHNFAVVRGHAPGCRIMAIVKADAYGHGIVRVARALPEADAFGVACIEEAEELRAAGIGNPLVLLEGPFTPEEIAALPALGLETVVHTPEQLAMIEQARPAAPIACWLKVDTGMHRLGFPPEEALAVHARLAALPHVAKGIRIMTHLASAQRQGDPSIPAQLDAFAALDGLPGPRCVANSAALLSLPATHGDWVRPGIMLYGVSPFAYQEGHQHGLQPVMTVRSALIAVRRVAAGGGVGYGATWRCPEDMPIGVVAVGYGDGYPRHLDDETPVLVGGVQARAIGRPSMDMLTVDLRAAPGAKVGDPVVLWGPELPVERVARHAATVPYELLCSVRMRARYTERGATALC